MRKIKFSWKFLLIPILCVCACFGTYGITAYLMDGDSLVNEFTNGSVTTEIEEDFPEPELVAGESFTKDVKITNTGESECYVRARVEFSEDFQYEDNGNYVDYFTINFNTAYWVYNENDGYHYYRNVLEKDETTESLFKTVNVDRNTPEDILEEDFDIIVYQESVQAAGFSSYTAAWDDYLKNKPTN